MTLHKIDGNDLAKMFYAGASHLTTNADQIDALNVFPVPDGDTGTNMNLSMTSGIKEVKQEVTDHAANVAQALSKGLLMGARGNSGVILSQIFRGFAKGMGTKETLTTEDLAQAFDGGVVTAYKAVMKPVEGTILTVAKDSAKKAVSVAKKETDIIVFMEKVLQEAKNSLKRTPELLPVLKEVGVVDSGGQGLVTIYEGFLASLKGEELPEISNIDMEDLINAEHHKINQGFMDTSEIEFGYCTEFMVKFEDEKLAAHPYNEDNFRNELSELGDSLLVVSDEDVVKVHVHSEQPGLCLTLAQRYGSLIDMKIENMREQHIALVGEAKQSDKLKEKADYAVITVAAGAGLEKLFESVGVNIVIKGGQTMNPSTQDITDAIEAASAKNIIILPNNKNIQMAAEQAAKLAKENVAVVPTRSIPQGINAMLMYNPAHTLKENEKEMSEAAKQVKTGLVTYAVRDTKIDGIEIAKDHFMGIQEGDIVAVDQDKLVSVKQLLDKMISEDDEILTILYGEDATEAEVEEMVQYVEEKYEDIEIETHNGEQPIYHFILAVE